MTCNGGGDGECWGLSAAHHARFLVGQATQHHVPLQLQFLLAESRRRRGHVELRFHGGVRLQANLLLVNGELDGVDGGLGAQVVHASL